MPCGKNHLYHYLQFDRLGAKEEQVLVTENSHRLLGETEVPTQNHSKCSN